MSVPISARKDGANMIIGKGPDVCKTPVGSSMVPVPYMTLVTLGPALRTAKTVRNNSKHDFNLNTRTRLVTGHEPGVGKGVKDAGYKGFAHVRTASSTVFSEGWAVVRHGDPAWINAASAGPQERRRSKSKTSKKHS
ncbi:MAG: PAAR-like domain-containing protein [Pseudomonadota bacterium]